MTESDKFNPYFYPAAMIPKPGSLCAFFENIPGKLEGLLNFLSMAAVEDEKMGEALALAESCLAFKKRKDNWDSYEKRILYWEKICETVGLASLEFRVAIMKQVDLYSSHLSHLKAIGSQPGLVQTSIDLGSMATDKTFKEREAIYKHNKFIPVAPTAVINANTNVGVSVQQNNLSLSSLTSFDELASKAMDAIRLEEPKQKMLQAQAEDFDESVTDVIEEQEEPVRIPFDPKMAAWPNG